GKRFGLSGIETACFGTIYRGRRKKAERRTTAKADAGLGQGGRPSRVGKAKRQPANFNKFFLNFLFVAQCETVRKIRGAPGALRSDACCIARRLRDRQPRAKPG